MRRVLCSLLALLTLLVLSGCTSNSSAAPEGGSFVFVSPGGKADFAYPAGSRQSVGDFTGSSVSDEAQTISLSNYPDEVIVLNIWGSWCGPCREEATDLNVAAELSAGKPVQFVGINVQDQRQAAADFLVGHKVPFPSIFDPTMRTLLSMQGYPTVGIPHTIVLDREHKVANIFLRKVTAQELDETITKILAETGVTAASSTGSTSDPATSDPATSGAGTTG